MPNGTYGGVRGRKTKVGGKLLLRFPPTRFLSLINNQRFMLQTLVVVTFWIIMYFIACAISPIVFFLMIIWTIYQIITVK